MTGTGSRPRSEGRDRGRWCRTRARRTLSGSRTSSSPRSHLDGVREAKVSAAAWAPRATGHTPPMPPGYHSHLRHSPVQPFLSPSPGGGAAAGVELAQPMDRAARVANRRVDPQPTAACRPATLDRPAGLMGSEPCGRGPRCQVTPSWDTSPDGTGLWRRPLTTHGDHNRAVTAIVHS